MKYIVLFAFVMSCCYSEPILLRKLHGELTEMLNSYQLSTSIPFTDCGGSSETITSLDLSPYPCKAGGVCHFTIAGNSKESFSVTKGVIDVYYSGVRIFQGNLDFKGTCGVGPCSLALDYNLPSFIPPGSYDMQINLEDGASVKHGCVKFSIKF